MTRRKQSPETQVAIGAMVRAARLQTGLSAAALGRRAGILAESVSDIERGKTGTTLAQLENIAEALGGTLVLPRIEFPDGLIESDDAPF